MVYHNRLAEIDFMSIIFGVLIGSIISVFLGGIQLGKYLKKNEYDTLEIKTKLKKLEDVVGSGLVDEAVRDPDTLWERLDALRGETNND